MFFLFINELPKEVNMDESDEDTPKEFTFNVSICGDIKTGTESDRLLGITINNKLT